LEGLSTTTLVLQLHEIQSHPGHGENVDQRTIDNKNQQYNAQERTIWLTKDESNLGWMYITSSLPFKQTDSEN